ncbi:MAG TPA: hypothetical protein VNT03_13430 [Baekduia sp.]|nr:hypothetical protein [Baekduia sp.]
MTVTSARERVLESRERLGQPQPAIGTAPAHRGTQKRRAAIALEIDEQWLRQAADDHVAPQPGLLDRGHTIVLVPVKERAVHRPLRPPQDHATDLETRQGGKVLGGAPGEPVDHGLAIAADLVQEAGKRRSKPLVEEMTVRRRHVHAFACPKQTQSRPVERDRELIERDERRARAGPAAAEVDRVARERRPDHDVARSRDKWLEVQFRDHGVARERRIRCATGVVACKQVPESPVRPPRGRGRAVDNKLEATLVEVALACAGQRAEEVHRLGRARRSSTGPLKLGDAPVVELDDGLTAAQRLARDLEQDAVARAMGGTAGGGCGQAAIEQVEHRDRPALSVSRRELRAPPVEQRRPHRPGGKPEQQVGCAAGLAGNRDGEANITFEAHIDLDRWCADVERRSGACQRLPLAERAAARGRLPRVEPPQEVIEGRGGAGRAAGSVELTRNLASRRRRQRGAKTGDQEPVVAKAAQQAMGLCRVATGAVAQLAFDVRARRTLTAQVQGFANDGRRADRRRGGARRLSFGVVPDDRGAPAPDAHRRVGSQRQSRLHSRVALEPLDEPVEPVHVRARAGQRRAPVEIHVCTIAPSASSDSGEQPERRCPRRHACQVSQERAGQTMWTSAARAIPA